MIVSIDWMKANFCVFNQKYFEGRLPDPHFGLSRARTQLGTMSFKRIRHLRKIVFSDFTIRLTTYYNMTERQAQNVLLHEMIHYAIGYHGLQDTSSHGMIFRAKMNELNRKYGWNISVMTSTKGWEVADWAECRLRRGLSSISLLLVLRLASGQYYLSRVNPKFAWSLERQLKVESSIKEHDWYTSKLEEFVNYPQVRSLRGRHLTLEEFRRFLPDMQEFHLIEK